jgi:hypothetical protein
VWPSAAAGVAVGLAVSLAGVSGSLSPFEHAVCVDRGQVSLGYYFLPAVLVNSPYGGRGWGNGTIAADYPGGPGYPSDRGAYGGGSLNGTAEEIWFMVNLSILGFANATEWGLGQNHLCSRGFSVLPLPPYIGPGFGGWGITVVNNLTDSGEAGSANFSGNFAGSPQSPIWNNGFTAANAPSVSTCNNSSPVSRYVQVPGPTVLVPFTESRAHLQASYTLPFAEGFHYVFPPRFGTWAVDNLSAPGGPGGGWAFAYAPCA